MKTEEAGEGGTVESVLLLLLLLLQLGIVRLLTLVTLVVNVAEVFILSVLLRGCCACDFDFDLDSCGGCDSGTLLLTLAMGSVPPLLLVPVDAAAPPVGDADCLEIPITKVSLVSLRGIFFAL